MDGDNELAVLLAEGNDLLDRGEPQAAIATFQRCHTPRPDHGGILFNLANAQLAARRLPDAVDTLVACLRCSPDFGPAYIGLADTLRRLTLLGHAQQMAETAVRLLPGRPAALLALANVLHDRTDYAGAADLYVRALTADPDDVGALTSLGNTLRIMGRIPEALAMQDRAVALAAGEPEIRFNRALARLAAGDYASGWEEYEFRWHRPGIRPRDIGPLWDGGCVAGRTVLLHAEQGLGDTLQFIRYADILRERGAQVVLEVQAELARLVRESMPFATVVTRGEALPHFDVHCPMLSMPRLIGTRLETVPASLPYLRCDRDRVESWRLKLPDNRPLLGLVWAGGAHPDDAGLYLIDQRRSLRPADLGPLAEIAGVHWVSLQKGRTERPFAMLDLMYEVEDFADTAALAANLDLVVAVDTSVAHLAAAMGRPVWLLSRYDGCWRWLHDRDDSPWYPGMRIYRQERPLDWSGVLRRVCADLDAKVAEYKPF